MVAWCILFMLLAAPVWAVEQRSHEPSLRELTAELDGLRQVMGSRLEGMKAMMDERDRMYSERDNSRRTAVEAALIAAKEQTASSFAASKEAIIKAEQAQHDYNMRSNEFRGQLDDQAKRLIARSEVEVLMKNLEEKIGKIEMDGRANREAITSNAGRGAGMDQLWQYILAGVGLMGSLGVGFYIARKTREHPEPS